MFDVIKVARVSENILGMTIHEWNEEFPDSVVYGKSKTYEEVAHRLVELINKGHWKYMPYVKQEIVVTRDAHDSPLSLSNIPHVKFEE